MKKTKTKTDAKSLWIKIGAIAFAVIFVATLLFSVLRYTTGVMHRISTAITVGDDKVTAMDMRIFYADTRANYLYQYGSILQMYGYDLSTIDSQPCLYDRSKTWAGYFFEQTLNSATNAMIIYQMAEADGYKTSDKVKADVADYLNDIELAAKEDGISVRKYLKKLYGTGTTLKDIEKVALITQSVSEYYESLIKGYRDGTTAEDVEKYYNEHKSDFDVANYFVLVVPFETVKYTAPKDGETLPEGAATSQEDAVLKTEENRKAAEALANEIKEKVTAENFDEIAKEYWTKVDAKNADVEFTTRLTTGKISDTTSLYGEWYNKEGITEGTKIVLDNSDKNEYVVALYMGRNREEIGTVNVRHILIGAVTEIDEKLSAEEKAAAEKAKADAKAEADKILADFLAGDKTEEAFSKLAKEKSHDSGSLTTGGLYENVAPGDMVSSFDKWIFDEARKPGDTEVVESQYGYHIIYFVGDGELDYVVNIKDIISSNKYNEKYDAFAEKVEVKNSNFGMMLAF